MSLPCSAAVTAPRLFVPQDLNEAAEVPLDAARSHYLLTVLRREPGAMLRLFNGRDGEFVGTLAMAGKRQAVARQLRLVRAQAAEDGPWLLFSLLKRDAVELVVQKATELGAAALLPVVAERSNTRQANTERLTAIAREAAEQCERLTVPEVHQARPLAAALAAFPAGKRLAAAVERAAGPPPGAGDHGLLVGPEGGFTEGELDVIRAAPFIRGVSLGSRILRAETASLAGLALITIR
jgi:16S rRNA (uracil1498-N3)-methyltransferase